MPADIRKEDLDTARLPHNWPSLAQSAVLHVMGIVRLAMLAGREALIHHGGAHDARMHRLECEVALLREELRINGARIRRIAAHRRPQYAPLERMAILELRALRGWS